MSAIACSLGGLSFDSGIGFSATASANEEVTLEGYICPTAEHIGEAAAIYVAFRLDGVFFFINTANELVEYNGNNLTPFQTQRTLGSENLLTLFDGVVGAPLDAVELFVAYEINDEFFLDEEPISFSIYEPNPLTVSSMSPAGNAISAAADSVISLTFDHAVDLTSIDTSDLRVFGRWSGVMDGELSLTNNNQTLQFTPERAFAAGEFVSATLVRESISTSDGGTTALGHTWGWWVATSPAELVFNEVATVSAREAGSDEQIQTYGAYAGDLNQDGWSDFVVPNEISNDLRIFLNDGAGNYDDFTIVPIELGDRPSPNEAADLDGDGDIDFIVGSAAGSHAHVFMGDGQGNLTQTQNLLVGDRVRGVCLVDIENDGDADLFATSFSADHISLFINDGTGTFSPGGALQAGSGEWSCASGDMNNDGLVDITVGSRTSQTFSVYLTDGDGTFTFAGNTPAAGDPWMMAAGDIDGDGNLDLAAANASGISLTTITGVGDGQLNTAQTYSLAENNEGFPLAVDLGDLDGGGDLDVVTADFRTRLFLIHENDGSGALTRLGANLLLAPEAASCAVLHDRDNDGDLDITGIDEVADLLILYGH